MGDLAQALDIDASAEAARIEAYLREIVGKTLRRKGVVLGVSGGVDSAVCVTLAKRALGADKVFAVLMPEKDSASKSTELGRLICEGLGVPYAVEDIAPALDALGCYRRRDEAIRTLFPEFGPDWKMKITVEGGALKQDRMNYFALTVQAPGGPLETKRMPLPVYLAVVASTNMKQRTRKMIEYFHAERLHYAVIGTPNKLEFDLGFFVRGGDGLADVKPIAHLYKTQVYKLAEAIGVPEAIRSQPPSTDTYSLPQTQEEFYFALPYNLMDLMLLAHESGVPAIDAARATNFSEDQAQRAFQDIVAKKRIATQLHQPALKIEG
ncbi:MAG: NAD(+) synthase [Hyphomicrobiales bacterium]|nr:MAG: NAD(+) synthase [Hyphomicrobiales bacterium]